MYDSSHYFCALTSKLVCSNASERKSATKIRINNDALFFVKPVQGILGVDLGESGWEIASGEIRSGRGLTISLISDSHTHVTPISNKQPDGAYRSMPLQSG